jgi:hypothetical protein
LPLVIFGAVLGHHQPAGNRLVHPSAEGDDSPIQDPAL